MKTENVVVKPPETPTMTREEFISTLSHAEKKVAEICSFPKKGIYKSFSDILDAKMNRKIGGN